MRLAFSWVSNLSELESAVNALENVFVAINADVSQVLFDFSKTYVLEPALAVTIVNTVQKLKSKGLTFQFDPNDPLEQQLVSGLRAACISGHPPASKLPGWVLPVSSFSGADPAIVDRIVVDIGSRLPNFSDCTRGSAILFRNLWKTFLFTVIVLGGGFISSSQNDRERRVRLAIGDFGRGIPGTLSTITPYNSGLDDDVVLYDAFKYSVTWKRGERMGVGLSYAADFVRAIGGTIRAYSGYGCVRIDEQRTCIRLAAVPYRGTLITIDLPTK